MKTQQLNNVLKAYRRNDVPDCALDRIVTRSTKAKNRIVENMLNGNDTFVFDMLLNHDQNINSGNWNVYELISTNNHYSWNMQNGTVTHRKTGHCMQIKKFFATIGNMIMPEVQQITLDQIGKKQTLFISCDPYFLLGSSVSSHGHQLESSCHYPTEGGDYCSGAVSYALDSCTLVFGLWHDNGIQGRQLVYTDMENGFITGRCYGDFTDAMSTACRQELYKLMKTPAYKKAKSGDAFSFDRNGYSGYLDDGYFTVYRHNHETVSICLTEAMCLECGQYHSDGGIVCGDCTGGYRCETCGDRVSEYDMCTSENGYVYCDSCYNDRYARCNHCSTELSRNNDTIAEINGHDYCEDCATQKGYSRCDECGEYTDDGITEYNGEYLCSDCLPSGKVCTDCGEYKADDDYTDSDATICADCEE